LSVAVNIDIVQRTLARVPWLSDSECSLLCWLHSLCDSATFGHSL